MVVEQKDVDLAIGKALRGVANDLRNALIKRAPVDTGRLKGSIRVSSVNKNEIEISMVDYAAYVEWGTPPHIIKAKGDNYLHFKVKDKWVKTKEVQHPGTRPNPFIRTTIKQDLAKIFIENMERQLK